MKYWAYNGDYNWICSQEEYPASEQYPDLLDNYRKVDNNYIMTVFWNDFAKNTQHMTDVFGNAAAKPRQVGNFYVYDVTDKGKTYKMYWPLTE